MVETGNKCFKEEIEIQRTFQGQLRVVNNQKEKEDALGRNKSIGKRCEVIGEHTFTYLLIQLIMCGS